ncbi:hypothetical protein XPA_010520 [Xanthoria parietina]
MRGNRGQPPANAAPKSRLDKAIDLRQRLVEEITRLKKDLAAAEAELRICNQEITDLEAGAVRRVGGNLTASA